MYPSDEKRLREGAVLFSCAGQDRGLRGQAMGGRSRARASPRSCDSLPLSPSEAQGNAHSSHRPQTKTAPTRGAVSVWWQGRNLRIPSWFRRPSFSPIRHSSREHGWVQQTDQWKQENSGIVPETFFAAYAPLSQVFSLRCTALMACDSSVSSEGQKVGRSGADRKPRVGG